MSKATLRKNFIPRNEGFACEQCKESVPPALGTFRNHCPHCLTSKHVDESVPGDRAATCGGLMPTTRYEGTDPDLIDLVQECSRCNKVMRNRVARDDDIQLLIGK